MVEVSCIPTHEDWEIAIIRAQEIHPTPYEYLGLSVYYPSKLGLRMAIERDGIAVEALSDRGYYSQEIYERIRDGLVGALEVVDQYWDNKAPFIYDDAVKKARTYRELTGEFNYNGQY